MHACRYRGSTLKLHVFNLYLRARLTIKCGLSGSQQVLVEPVMVFKQPH